MDRMICVCEKKEWPVVVEHMPDVEGRYLFGVRPGVGTHDAVAPQVLSCFKERE